MHHASRKMTLAEPACMFTMTHWQVPLFAQTAGQNRAVISKPFQGFC